MKLLATPYIIGGAFLAGTFGGGWVMHKVWYGKAQSAKLAAKEAALSATESALTESRGLLESAARRAQTEATARQEAEQRLSRAYADNAMLAQSRASTTTRIIERGEEIGQTLKDDNPWIYYTWPRELTSHAFNKSSDVTPSDTAFYLRYR